MDDEQTDEGLSPLTSKIFKDVQTGNMLFIVLIIIGGAIVWFTFPIVGILSFLFAGLFFYFNSQFKQLKAGGRTGLVVLYSISIINFALNALLGGSFVGLFALIIAGRQLITIATNKEIQALFSDAALAISVQSPVSSQFVDRSASIESQKDKMGIDTEKCMSCMQSLEANAKFCKNCGFEVRKFVQKYQPTDNPSVD